MSFNFNSKSTSSPFGIFGSTYGSMGGSGLSNAKKTSKKIFTYAQIAEHRTMKDCWIIIQKRVYNVTDYLSKHPPGPSVILRYAGQDATSAFAAVHHSMKAKELMNSYYIGDVDPASEAVKSSSLSVGNVKSQPPVSYPSTSNSSIKVAENKPTISSNQLPNLKEEFSVPKIPIKKEVTDSKSGLQHFKPLENAISSTPSNPSISVPLATPAQKISLYDFESSVTRSSDSSLETGAISRIQTNDITKGTVENRKSVPTVLRATFTPSTSPINDRSKSAIPIASIVSFENKPRVYSQSLFSEESADLFSVKPLVPNLSIFQPLTSVPVVFDESPKNSPKILSNPLLSFPQDFSTLSQGTNINFSFDFDNPNQSVAIQTSLINNENINNELSIENIKNLPVTVPITDFSKNSTQSKSCKSSPASSNSSRAVLSKLPVLRLTVLERTSISPDTYLIRLKYPSSVYFAPTNHIKIICKSVISSNSPDVRKIIRSYTPISIENGVITLAVKWYKMGAMSSFLCNIPIGTVISAAGPFCGKFVLDVKNPSKISKNIFMIAAGTGITPMIQIIDAILSLNVSDVHLQLLFSNRTEADILFKSQLDTFARNYPNIFANLTYVLTREQNSSKINTFYGRISATILQQFFGEKLTVIQEPSNDCQILICGSAEFGLDIMTCLTDNLHASLENILIL